jgi:predicted lipid carrier protein YhbT
MRATDNRTAFLPSLSRPLASPLSILPEAAHGMAGVSVLNRILADALGNGELDFLRERVMRVRVDDLGVAFHLSLGRGRLVATRRRQVPDLAISGSLHAFLLLTARREDTDTLFFQRRLRMEGDTELGLEVKNFLDALDQESHRLLRRLSLVIGNALPVYERLFGWSGAYRC